LVSCGVWFVHCLLDQLGLYHGTGIHVWNSKYVRLYATLTGASLILLAGQRLFAPPIPIGVGLAAVVSLAVLWMNRGSLEIDTTFPELARLPGMKSLLGSARSR
jgi:hypothetical protein